MRTLKHFAIVLLVALAGLPGVAAPLSKADLQTIGIDQRLGANIPANLAFTDSTGTPVNFTQLVSRKPTLLALVYFDCPNLCTVVLNAMVSSVDDLRRDVGNGFQIVVVSIDPTETPTLAAARKKAYIRRYSRGVNQAQEWSFLTGDAANIHRLADAVGYHYRYDPELRQYAHGSGLMLLDTQGRLVKYFLGIEYQPADLESAIQLAQKHGTGSPVQDFILLCYCYNPLTGPYGWVVFSALKLCALLTVGALGWFIIAQVRRDLQGRGAAP